MLSKDEEQTKVHEIMKGVTFTVQSAIPGVVTMAMAVPMRHWVTIDVYAKNITKYSHKLKQMCRITSNQV